MKRNCMLFWDHFDKLNDFIFYSSDSSKLWYVSEKTKWLLNDTSEVIKLVQELDLC